MGWFSDFVSNPIDTLGNTGQKVMDNPIPAITAAATGNPAALLAYAAPTGSVSNSGLLSTAGSILQNRSNVAGNQTAAQATQFRPVGITNTFGTSQFAVDPTTGQITSAGYNLSPQLQAAQNTLMGNQAQNLTDLANIQNLGRGYLAQSPQQAAQQYIQNQQALLAPGREQAWANLANQDYNRGTMGLKVAQGGGLQAANPYAAALANAQAQQDLQLAANAQQAGQQQTLFGQGLLSSAYQPYTTGLQASAATEQLGQSPFGLSTDLATKAALAGGNAAPYLKAAGQTNTLAQLLGGASANPLLNSLFGGGIGDWTTGSSVIPQSTFGGYGDVTDLAQYGVF